MDLMSEVKYDEKGLVPAIAQDNTSNEVLMMAYMNEDALQMTLNTGFAHYFSRSRNKLWKKGEESGHVQRVQSVSLDCDGDTILLKVEQKEAACHTGHVSCFYRDIKKEGIFENAAKVFDPKQVYGDPEHSGAPLTQSISDQAQILKEVYNVICDRRINPKEGSYTNYLFEKGVDKILKKVGEEASEVIIAAKNRSASELRYEIADLFYHLLVLMAEQDLKPEDIYEELAKRR